VIARDYITQWSVGAPWPQRQQIEQDLILSRLILEIAGDSLLGKELAFRGRFSHASPVSTRWTHVGGPGESA
jgi:hypothetical protein